MHLDMRTVMIGQTMVAAVCALVMTLLWRHARKRYPGLGYLAADFGLLLTGTSLITLRGFIPDLLSIFVANSLNMLGQYYFCRGLAMFVGKPWSGRLEIAAFGVFSAAFYYFSAVSPELPARNLLITGFIVFFCARAIWLLLRGVSREFKALSRLLVGSLAAFILVSLLRFLFTAFGHPAHDFFANHEYDTLLIMAYSGLLVSLTFGIYLMVNRRLMADTLSDFESRVSAEAELRASEERFAKAFRSAPMLMSLNEIGTGRYLEVNDKFCEVSGFSREEVIGKTPVDIGWVTDEVSRKLIEELDGKSSLRIPELELRAKGGRQVTCSYACERIGMGGKEVFLAIAEDITAVKAAELAQHAAQKLESLGTLAGGIAHDFNNLLTGITGSLSMLKRAPCAETAELVKEAETACHTAKGLARQLLTFAYGGEPVKAPLDLSELAAESVSFSLRGSPVKGKVSSSGGPVHVSGDKEQLFQVVHNLVVNAAQAMPAGGAIEVNAGTADLADGAVHGLRAGRYSFVSVRDSGHGMPPDILSRAFDPYFSTKGKGRGLGLSVCRSIVLKHHGQLTVASEQGKGSVFTVYLPETAERPVRASSFSPPLAKTDGGRMLVMEDEVIVYKALRRMLTELGYEVEVALHGEAALDAWKEAKASGRPFAGAIMDLTISGGMGGAEAVKALKALDPAAKVVVSSGYSDNAVMADYAAYGFDASLAKPYQLEELSAVLDKLFS